MTIPVQEIVGLPHNNCVETADIMIARRVRLCLGTCTPIVIFAVEGSKVASHCHAAMQAKRLSKTQKQSHRSGDPEDQLLLPSPGQKDEEVSGGPSTPSNSKPASMLSRMRDSMHTA